MLVAPDKFKGSATAREVASALGRGLARGEATVVLRPIADGGEGTLDALLDVGFLVHDVPATEAFGRPVNARVGVRARMAVVEMTDVCRKPERPTSRDAMSATTGGLAAPVLAAERLGCREVVVAVGGSASTDGGAGLLRGLGARLLRPDGSTVEGVGDSLAEVDRIDLSDVSIDGPLLRFAVDVANPLLGPTGAARMFAPQKGASDDDVTVLERALGHLAEVAAAQVGHDISSLAGTGAGGGVAFLPVALLGAQVCSGADLVLDLLGVDALLDDVDVVITGEGSWDAQTAEGKAPEVLLRRARDRGKPVVVVAGSIARDDAPPGVNATVSLTDRAGSVERAMARVIPLLEEVGHDLAARLSSGPATADPPGWP